MTTTQIVPVLHWWHALACYQRNNCPVVTAIFPRQTRSPRAAPTVAFCRVQTAANVGVCGLNEK